MSNTSTNLLDKMNKAQEAPKRKQTAVSVLKDYLGSNDVKSRLENLLDKRAPQFVSSLINAVTNDKNLQECDPRTTIQAAIQAATFDLPISQSLGYAYLVPFRDNATGRKVCTFILGYRGMIQLALRTGVYRNINVVDVREGELKKWDRLTEELVIEFIEDEDERESRPVVGYAGYFGLVNGFEKRTYWTVGQIDAHEKKFRKGQYQTKGWKENYDEMAKKTVLRNLIGKWGLMSIEYQGSQLADAMENERQIDQGADYGDEDNEPIPADFSVLDDADEEPGDEA